MNPSLREFIPATVGYITERGGYVTKTKLLKLLYLFDVEYFRCHRQTFTGFNWKYFHLGPWTAEFDPLIEQLVDSDLLERTASFRPEYETTFYKSSFNADFDKLLKSYKDGFTLRTILDTWGTRPTGEVLDYVYFRTEPMEEAIRNEKLDFSKISEAEPAKYKRNASGISPKDIRKCRAEFKKRTSVQRQEKRFAFTAPNYDEEYDRAMTKLDELAR